MARNATIPKTSTTSATCFSFPAWLTRMCTLTIPAETGKASARHREPRPGGVTTLVDMPLNCVPETVNVEALEAKRQAATGNTWVDWAAWGGVVKDNVEAVPALAQTGVRGFKCFMIDSGIDGFAWVNESDLRLALERLRGTQLPLLVHAEVAGPIESRDRIAQPGGR